mgnify:CR=1 FL=1
MSVKVIHLKLGWLSEFCAGPLLTGRVCSGAVQQCLCFRLQSLNSFQRLFGGTLTDFLCECVLCSCTCITAHFPVHFLSRCGFRRLVSLELVVDFSEEFVSLGGAVINAATLPLAAVLLVFAFGLFGLDPCSVLTATSTRSKECGRPALFAC